MREDSLIQLTDDRQARAIAVADMLAGRFLRRQQVVAGEGVDDGLMLAFRLFRPFGQGVSRAAQERGGCAGYQAFR